MKIIINNKYILPPEKLAYIGIKAIGILLKKYENNKSFLIIAAILEEMEIVFNNFSALDEELKQELIVDKDFKYYRNYIAHPEGMMQLFSENKQEVQEYYDTYLVPIKNKIEASLGCDFFIIKDDAPYELPNSRFMTLMTNVSAEIKKINSKSCNSFTQATTEILLARYFLEQSNSCFESLAFARIAICSIREQYRKLIDQPQALSQIFKSNDPFYQMLYIRNIFAHEKYPDLISKNPTILLTNLMHAVGVSDGSYLAIKERIETNNFEKKPKKGKLAVVDASNRFLVLPVEDQPDQESAPVAYDKEVSIDKPKTKKKHKSKKADNESEALLEEAIKQNEEFRKLEQEKQAKIDEALNVQKMFEISRKLTVLFAGIISLSQKIIMPLHSSFVFETGNVEYTNQVIKRLVLKTKIIAESLLGDIYASHIDQTKLNTLVKILGHSLDCSKKVIVCFNKIIQECIDDKKKLGVVASSIEFTDEELDEIGKKLNADISSKLLKAYLQKINEEYIAFIISSDFFDPNIEIFCRGTPYLDPTTYASDSQIFDFDVVARANDGYKWISDPICNLAYIMKLDSPELVRSIISKGNHEARVQLLRSSLAYCDKKRIETFCKIYSEEGFDIEKLLNQTIMKIHLLKKNIHLTITPIELLEYKAIESISTFRHEQKKCLGNAKSPIELDSIRKKCAEMIANSVESKNILCKYGSNTPRAVSDRDLFEQLYSSYDIFKIYEFHEYFMGVEESAVNINDALFSLLGQTTE
jgi:hypothetical protein